VIAEYLTATSDAEAWALADSATSAGTAAAIRAAKFAVREAFAWAAITVSSGSIALT
jgi:hypothetical protein